jgi:hypothetical protein
MFGLRPNNRPQEALGLQQIASLQRREAALELHLVNPFHCARSPDRRRPQP